MATATKVGSHKRRTPDGDVITVSKHDRSTRGGSGRRRGRKSLPRRSWSNAKSAAKYFRRKKRLAAAGLVTLAVTEIAVWVGLRGVAAAFATVAVIATAVVGLAYAASNGGRIR